MYSAIRIFSCTKVNNELLDGDAVCYVHHTVKRLLAKLGHAHLDHEDIAQDVLVVLTRWQDRYEAEKADKYTFIYRILRHKVIDIIRRRSRRVRDGERKVESLNKRVYDEDGAAVELGALLADGRLEKEDERAELLCAIVTNLPSAMRRVYDRLGKSSYRDICRELGITRHAYYKVIKQLRDEFVAAGILKKSKIVSESPTRFGAY